MAQFLTRAGIAPVRADLSTGQQAIPTPWGHVKIREGDVMVPHGDRTVPVPRALWDMWFEDVTPRPPEPEAGPMEWPEPARKLTDLSRRELHALARSRYGVELSDNHRPMRYLIEDIRRLESERA